MSQLADATAAVHTGETSLASRQARQVKHFSVALLAAVVLAFWSCSWENSFVVPKATSTAWPGAARSGGHLATRLRATRGSEVATRPPSEYRLTLGHAIDVLRTDVSGIFDRGTHPVDFSIFSEDVEVVDARVPSFRINGLRNYQQVISTLQWSVQASCEDSNLQITALNLPMNNEVYMRWRLQLWPRDVFASAKSLFAPLDSPATRDIFSIGLPIIVEGYSRYEFDPWSAEIVRHTIDITNPPMPLSDLMTSQHALNFAWLTPSMTPSGVRFPMQHAMLPVAVSPTADMGSSLGAASTGNAFSGATQQVSSARGRASARPAGSWLPMLPQTCEDDFECNDGKANFPLQCCELPILGKFCCEPDDFEPVPQNPAWVPIPVPVEDPWRQ